MADLRRCIGSARFGIEAHKAPVTEFPTQPSRKDGLGRMCKVHWNQYTNALRNAALARKATDDGAVAPTGSEAAPVAARRGVDGRNANEARTPKPEPIRTKATRTAPKAAEPIAETAEADVA